MSLLLMFRPSSGGGPPPPDPDLTAGGGGGGRIRMRMPAQPGDNVERVDHNQEVILLGIAASEFWD